MSIQTLDPTSIRKRGLEVLAKELGPIGMIRFLQQFESGTGDYTVEREQWLKEEDVKSVVEKIKKRRTIHKPAGN